MSNMSKFEEVFPFIGSNGRLDLEKFVKYEMASRFMDNVDEFEGVVMPDEVVDMPLRVPRNPEWVTIELEAGHFRALQILAKRMNMSSPHLNVMLRDREAFKARLADISSYHSTPTCHITAEDAYAYLLLSLLGGGPKKWFEGLTETGRFETFDGDVIGRTTIKKNPKNAARVVKKGYNGLEMSVWPRPRSIADLVAECAKISNAVCAMNVSLGDSIASDAVDYVAKTRLLTIILQAVGSSLINCLLRHLGGRPGFLAKDDANEPTTLCVLTGAFGVAMRIVPELSEESVVSLALERANQSVEQLLGCKAGFAFWPFLPKLPFYQLDGEAASKFFFGSVKKRKAETAVESIPAEYVEAAGIVPVSVADVQID